MTTGCILRRLNCVSVQNSFLALLLILSIRNCIFFIFDSLNISFVVMQYSIIYCSVSLYVVPFAHIVSSLLVIFRFLHSFCSCNSYRLFFVLFEKSNKNSCFNFTTDLCDLENDMNWHIVNAKLMYKLSVTTIILANT